MIIRRTLFLFTAVSVLAVAGAHALLAQTTAADVRRQIRAATANFKDLTLDTRIDHANQRELAVIGKDFGKAYEFKNSKLWFKMPDMVKMQAKAGFVNVTYIITGDTKRIQAGVIRKTDDIKEEPHKKQTALDLGIATETIWDEFQVAYHRADTFNGRPCHVLALNYPASPDKKEYVWIDARDFRIWQRERREADGSLRVRFVYSKHREFRNVIWVPGEVRVFNGNLKHAGTSVYTNIRVNTGLSNDIFR